MRILHSILLLLIFAGIGVARADDAEKWISAGLDAEARHDPSAALLFFRKANEARPGNPFVLQKIAKQLSDAAFLREEDSARKQLAAEALGFALRAAELNPESAVNQLSLSVLYGKLAVYSDLGTKVEYARRIRQHAEAALALDPDYAWACHVLGRWHAGMSELNAAKRALASILFGGLPKATLTEGIRLLERAVELEPDALAHRIELGFAYAQAGRTEEARTQWRLGLELPSIEIYDEAARRRALAALAKVDGPPQPQT